jgi:CBS-domain-containing membrane protein
MSEKKIRDIMVPLDGFLTVYTSDSFESAVATLKKAIDSTRGPGSGHPHLLAYENNVLIGLVRISDLLEAIRPQFLTGSTYRGWDIGNEWQIPVFWEGLFTERTREAIDNKTVKDILYPVSYSVEADDPLIKAVYGMTRYMVNALPVTEDGRVTGIIGVKELFHEIADLVVTDEAEIHTLNKFIEAGRNEGWAINSTGGN